MTDPCPVPEEDRPEGCPRRREADRVTSPLFWRPILVGIAGSVLTGVAAFFVAGAVWGATSTQVHASAREIQALQAQRAQDARDISSLQAQFVAMDRRLEQVQRSNEQIISILTSRTP